MTEQEYLRNIAIINNAPTIPPLPTLSPEEQAELENFGKFDDEISRTIERKNRLFREALAGKPWDQLTPEEQKRVEDYHALPKDDWIKESQDLTELLETNYDVAVAKAELINKLHEEKVTNNDLYPNLIQQKELDQYKYDPTSKSFVKVEPLSDLRNAYNDKLTNEQVAKHYNSFQPDPNYHVEVVAEELETTWSKVKSWFKQLF